jgi:hypothetical protein
VTALGACSHAKKKTPELSEMLGKKVALVSIEGEPTGRSVVEVALINQLLARGSFELIGKREIEAAASAPDQDPRDWQGLARRAGADYAMRAKILSFDSDVTEGYSKESVEDSQLNEEQGPFAPKDGKSDRLYKVKRLVGHVKIELQFARLAETDLRTGFAEARDEVTEEARAGAIHLPPRLRFLEQVANAAFKKFFEENN